MIAEDQFHARLLQHFIIRYQRIAHRCPELITRDESPQMVLRFILRIAIISLDHLLPLDIKGGIKRYVGREEGLLILVIELTIRGLL